MRLKAAALVLFLILTTVPALPQADTAIDGVVTLNNWGISIIPLLAQKNKIQGDRSLYNLGSSPQLGMEVLIHYFAGLGQQYSLIYSLGGGVMAHNFSFSVPKELMDPPVNADITFSKGFARELDLFYFKAGVAAQGIFSANLRSDWVAVAGGTVAYSPASDVGTDYSIARTDGSIQTYLSTDDNYNNDRKPWANFHINAGRQWRLNWGHLFQVMLKLNFSPTKFFSGAYTFEVGNQAHVSGRYGMSGSYVGINLSYVFSQYKKVKRQ